jgi:hypothetical protein
MVAKKIFQLLNRRVFLPFLPHSSAPLFFFLSLLLVVGGDVHPSGIESKRANHGQGRRGCQGERVVAVRKEDQGLHGALVSVDTKAKIKLLPPGGHRRRDP